MTIKDFIHHFKHLGYQDILVCIQEYALYAKVENYSIHVPLSDLLEIGIALEDAMTDLSLQMGRGVLLEAVE